MPAGTSRTTPSCSDWFGQGVGESYVDYYVQTKKDEFNAYHSEVSGWELRRYLTLF